MVITEVRIKLMDENNERLQAFCSVTFDDCFVIRDLKIIEGTKGSFVAMPSRKLTDRCTHCGSKNHLRARHCNQCGANFTAERVPGHRPPIARGSGVPPENRLPCPKCGTPALVIRIPNAWRCNGCGKQF